MDIFHRIFISTSKENFTQTVQTLGIPHHMSSMQGEIQWMYFDIKESDPNWPIIAELIEKEGASDSIDTIFDDDEIRTADWLRLVSVFEQGYPQPKLHWPIKQQSYKNVCEKCGIYEQINSLRIQKEPHLGKKSFVSPIWVGEIFCTPEVISNFKAVQAQGFDAWDVKIQGLI